jgi:hypothetical protein
MYVGRVGPHWTDSFLPLEGKQTIREFLRLNPPESRLPTLILTSQHTFYFDRAFVPLPNFWIPIRNFGQVCHLFARHTPALASQTAARNEAPRSRSRQRTHNQEDAPSARKDVSHNTRNPRAHSAGLACSILKWRDMETPPRFCVPFAWTCPASLLLVASLPHWMTASPWLALSRRVLTAR